MPVPELERREQQLSKFCEERVPTHVRHKVRLLFRFSGNTALLIAGPLDRILVIPIEMMAAGSQAKECYPNGLFTKRFKHHPLRPRAGLLLEQRTSISGIRSSAMTTR